MGRWVEGGVEGGMEGRDGDIIARGGTVSARVGCPGAVEVGWGRVPAKRWTKKKKLPQHSQATLCSSIVFKRNSPSLNGHDSIKEGILATAAAFSDHWRVPAPRRRKTRNRTGIWNRNMGQDRTGVEWHCRHVTYVRTH